MMEFFMAYERKSVNECLASTLKCLNLEKSLFIPEIKDFTEEEIAKLIKEHRYFNYEDFLILLDNKLQELTGEDFKKAQYTLEDLKFYFKQGGLHAHGCIFLSYAAQLAATLYLKEKIGGEYAQESLDLPLCNFGQCAYAAGGNIDLRLIFSMFYLDIKDPDGEIEETEENSILQDLIGFSNMMPQDL